MVAPEKYKLGTLYLYTTDKWLKLFLYQLDVGTSNALVLYNLATDKSSNMVTFKKELINAFVGY